MMLCKKKYLKKMQDLVQRSLLDSFIGIDPFFHKCVTHHIKWMCPEQARKVGGHVNVMGGIDLFLLNF